MKIEVICVSCFIKAEERKQADCLDLSHAYQILEHHEDRTNHLESDNFCKQSAINQLDSVCHIH